MLAKYAASADGQGNKPNAIPNKALIEYDEVVVGFSPLPQSWRWCLQPHWVGDFLIAVHNIHTPTPRTRIALNHCRYRVSVTS